ncbi:MAG TPA: excinuclease ABC subunit C [Elusimicrobia bacterium]|nr:excinuclease ABC subunit C [Elusimicrobiota bacterium]
MSGPGRSHLPHACGVYLMRDAAMRVLYVGKAKDLARRVAQYFNPNKPDLKNQALAPLIFKIDYLACSSEREALIWERKLIGEHQPFFNSMWKDDKSYPFVKITLEEEFPRLIVVRKKRRDGGAYFGPYPHVSAVRSLLKALWRRKVFPLRPCDYAFSSGKPLDPAKIKSCLYYHTGECPAPCAGRIAPAAYRRIAQDAVLFFEGRFGRLKERLRSEMRKASRKLEYEKAARLRDNVLALEHMEERVLYEEVRPAKVAVRLDASRGVSDLQEALGLRKPPLHVECFDVSHLFGKEAVGSMVCFKAGEPHKAHYRRFRIRSVEDIDDFAAMAEIVSRRVRRLQASGEEPPDLLVVDGGKGQLSAAAGALEALGASFPLAALAKREEEVFVLGRAGPLRLGRERAALRLLQRLRDEAHRFAVTYHRLLRKKELFHETA